MSREENHDVQNDGRSEKGEYANSLNNTLHTHTHTQYFRLQRLIMKRDWKKPKKTS